MQITYRLPSSVPYAYVEVTFDSSEELPNFREIAYDYARSLGDFKQEEKNAIQGKNLVQAPPAPLFTPVDASNEAPPAKAKPKMTKAEADTVASLLFGPKSDEVDNAAQLIKDELGATEINGDDPKAPWNNKQDEPKSTPSTTDDDWDFDF